MEDNDPRVGEERIGGRGDEYVSGREGAAEPRRANATPRPADDDPNRRSRELRREIERTRDDMSETVEAIQDRLSPRNIAANAVESVRTAASDKAREFSEAEPVQYVRANPIPTAMVGVGLAGLAWLAFGGREADRSREYRRDAAAWRRSSGYYEVDDPRGPRRTERFSHGTASEYSPGLAYGNAGRLREVSPATSDQLARTWNENPLLMGAAAAVFGAIVGMAVPETEPENRLMGEARDTMVEGVQQTVRDKVEQVGQAASNAVGEVQKAVGLTDDRATSPEPGRS